MEGASRSREALFYCRDLKMRLPGHQRLKAKDGCLILL